MDSEFSHAELEQVRQMVAEGYNVVAIQGAMMWSRKKAGRAINKTQENKPRRKVFFTDRLRGMGSTYPAITDFEDFLPDV